MREYSIYVSSKLVALSLAVGTAVPAAAQTPLRFAAEGGSSEISLGIFVQPQFDWEDRGDGSTAWSGGLRRQAFTDRGQANAALSQILRVAADHTFAVIAYTLMPDHVHLLAEGMDATSDMCSFANLAKQRTATATRRQPESVYGNRATGTTYSGTKSRPGTWRGTSATTRCAGAWSRSGRSTSSPGRA